MIKSANNYPISQLFDIESKWLYEIPKYQREYTWGKSQWETLYDDLLENDIGYYLGSIICVNKSDDVFETQTLELIDGQQRLITLSLLFAAIYCVFNQPELDLNDEQRADSFNIKRKLVLKGDDEQVRLIPQIQNNNNDDFFAVLSDAGLIRHFDAPRFAPNRRIFKAYRYFRRQIEDSLSNDQENAMEFLEELLKKLNSACMVKIEVSSHADAYTLFESLNNRGIPLNAIDLIKNKLLASFDSISPTKVDLYFDRWVKLLDHIGDEYATQERFFRHYYNAFRTELATTIQASLATRSNLIRIYEKLIDADAEFHMDRIFMAGQVYSYILMKGSSDTFATLKSSFTDLERIQGTPSHLLLLFLMFKHEELELTDAQLSSIVGTLVSFFVRRNLTDVPATRDLTSLFMSIIDEIQGCTGESIVNYVEKKLIEESASDELFRSKLCGPIYSENTGVTRFVLYTLAQEKMTRETEVDLWRREKGQFVWTIEHVLPQGVNLPEAWVDLFAAGNVEKAREIQEEHVHKLGNLTISGYNSSLGNKSFAEKRDRKDSEGRFVGYRNGISLNADLASATTWSVEQIEERTGALVSEVMDRFELGSVTS